MATKGSSGSRRWIQHRPSDKRPIVGMYDDNIPAWLRFLERIAPAGCVALGGFVIALAAYAWAVDLFAGHIRG